MSSLTIIDRCAGGTIHTYGSELGMATWGPTFWGRARLPTEPIGTFNLTLQNVVVGSRWEIEIASAPGVSVTSGVAAASTVPIALNAYAPGNSLNVLVVKVRNASASPYYQSFETQVTAAIGSNNIFINQVRDDV